MTPDRRTYIRLHDGMPDHPKLAKLPAEAKWLYVEALCYCSRYLTDGVISEAVLRQRGSVKALAALKLAGLIEPHGEDWAVHDYLLHQRSAAEVAAMVEQRKAAGRAGGLAKGKRGAKQVAKQTGSETPSKPLPSTETETDTTKETLVVDAASPRRARAIRDFELTDGMRAWAAHEEPTVNVETETAKFIDHFTATGRPMKDWTAAWRNWIRNSATRQPVRPLRAVGQSTTDQRVSDALALSARYEQEDHQ